MQYQKKKKTQNKNESEEIYKFPIGKYKVPINIFSEDMKILDVNKGLIQISGYSKKELTSMKLKDIYPESAEILIEGIKKKVDNKEFPIFKVNLHNKKGKIIPVEIVVTEHKNLYGPGTVFQGTVRDSNAFMHMNNNLADIEKSFRTLAEATFNIIMIFDRDCRNIYVNPAIEKLSGIPPEDFIGKTFVQLGLSNNLVKLCEEAIYNVFEAKTNRRVELKLPNNKQIDALLVPEFDEKGYVKVVIVYAQDITDYKHIKERLKESEDKYHGFVNSCVDAVISVDMQMRIIMWNPAAEKLFGYNEKEILGKSLMKIVPKRYRKRKEKGFDEYKKTHSGAFIGKTGELKGLRKDGTEIPIELSVLSTRVRDKEITMAIIRDITERKMMEESLRNSEEYQRTIFSSIHTGIIVVDERTHEIIDVNRIAADTIGVSKEKIIGNICHKYVCPADEGKCPISDLDQVVDNSERVLLNVNGKEIPILKTVVPIKLNGRECILESFIDITERKKMEMALSWEMAINNALAKLSKKLLSQASIEDITYLVLKYAKDLTQSKDGFVGYIDPETGYLIVPNPTRNFREKRKIKDKNIIFKTFRGLWGWVLNNKESILTNDPAWDPRSTGTPESHIAINSFVSAPAMIEDKLVWQVALANSDHDYTKEDLKLIERLADIYAIAINRQLLEEKIHKSEEKHRKIVEKFLETVSENK